LDLVNSDWRERGVVPLSGSNADDTIERLNEDLSVADCAGTRRVDDRIYRRFDERLRAGHFDLDLFVKLEEELRPAPDRHGVTLPTVTARASDGDARDARAKQRFLDRGEAVGTDDAADEFHRSRSIWQMTTSAALLLNILTVLLQRDG
jgi:hypothetical protein